jgi:hypothetical protein
MKLFAALAFLATASANCPAHSKQTAFPYADMRSCACDAGYKAYAYPGVGCYVAQNAYSCPANGANRPGVVDAKSFADCKCADGYVADNNKCVYAYLFQVHGRVWLQPYTIASFTLAKENDFRAAMAGLLGLKTENILPYSIHEAKDIKQDIYSAQLDHAKMILAQGETGQISKANAISVGFAVQFRGDKNSEGNTAVDSLKAKASGLKAALDGKKFHEDVKFVNVFVWALTAQFWKPKAEAEAPYQWAPKTESTAYPTPASAKTPAPTVAPTTPLKPFKRADICGTFFLKGTALADFTGAERAAFTIALAGYLKVPAQEMFIKAVHPYGRESDVYYSPAHSTWVGTEVTACSNVYSNTEAYAILAKLRAYTGTKSVIFSTKTIKVTSTAQTPTAFPTKAPTPAPQLPGSRPNCASGVVMEIAGAARFQSADRLENVEGTSSNKAVDFMNKARKCMATSVGHGVEYCAIRSTRWNEKAYDCGKTKKLMETGDHVDAAQEYESCTLWAYTFTFLMAVPGQNMHNGNEVYDSIHYKNSDFIKNVNKCTGAGFYIPPKVSLGNNFRPTSPSFETVNVTSIELTYVAAAKTPAPTPSKVVTGSDCVVSAWSAFTTCSKSCGTGTQSRWRVIVTPNSGNGKACPALNTMQKCNKHLCPVDCVVADWSAWSACSHTCGQGTQTRTRAITAQAFMGGKKCPALTATQTCKSTPCPVDCKLSDWGEYTRCDKACGTGKMWRRRTIVHTQYYGGAPCGALIQNAKCNEQPCPTNCVVSGWSAWGSCSKTCAGKAPGTRLFGAKQERTRYVKVQPQNGGHPCPSLSQTKLCALHPCGAHVCSTDKGFPLTCTYERGIVYTHHVNDVHDNELFMCYHNLVTSVCTCLCWPKSVGYVHRSPASDVNNFQA